MTPSPSKLLKMILCQANCTVQEWKVIIAKQLSTKNQNRTSICYHARAEQTKNSVLEENFRMIKLLKSHKYQLKNVKSETLLD